MIKRLARGIVVAILARQVRKLRELHQFKIVGVVGGIGKTSTKRAIAETLGTGLRVRYQAGNYNDLASVPLVFFGQEMPKLFNPFAWIKVFLVNEKQLRREYPYDAVVVEIGTDGPGQIGAFERYLSLDLAVVTAVVPEHMEYFDDLDAVAKEELSVARYADIVAVNTDLVDKKYIAWLDNPLTYSMKTAATYRGKTGVFRDGKSNMTITKHNKAIASASLPIFSEAQVYSAVAASVAWDVLRLPLGDFADSLHSISAVPGRLQLLKGLNSSTIIDDSYNASPEAMVAALETVYRMSAPHKVVLLGNMNELGAYSEQAHTFVGEYCSPKELDEVVTLGPDANRYLAEAARAQGCKVTSFDSPYAAGDYLFSILRKNSLVLVKGSQNKVFAEEAIKPILASSDDVHRLVRQSPEWMTVKQAQFTDV